jgi:hypothetical protein
VGVDTQLCLEFGDAMALCSSCFHGAKFFSSSNKICLYGGTVLSPCLAENMSNIHLSSKYSSPFVICRRNCNYFECVLYFMLSHMAYKF